MVHVFLKEFFEKVDFEKKSFDDKKHAKLPSMQRDKLSRDMKFPTCGICDQQSLRPAYAYVQSDQRLCWSLEYSMNVKLLRVTKFKGRLHRLV